ncbi:MAG: hypothetical protein US71_C0011G0005 [Parcubacteria group bacterium GW2011_GWD2_38_12]|uniref:Uncharacterized protein n=1 Tax=Candidatus Azambacteria bacterium RIFCSPLOWO2_01_FULL_37_9 TaxID=1797297 RepID=A0A1F5C7Z3_9BACT|nr:MAG: hypothetical protein US06_C0006G0058 [Parcubacteria group bacterium GW2011_GWC2_36_17]KKQ43799.1 MAG: hypothetical protein US61_C0003G0009 [Parcubacteria group bacterium GW2011_GWE2_37_8]KKQ51449.1 MAG: hypothetical protein US71_C0011G0005 [Parcubacteria group bacterium GW2011_GWD2_38_12]KKQ58726.1 MAG: hypothetical protein US79_C0003G0027 [Parcubacteria group bacterium GW2011_GWC1_38_17]KKQ59319.1 MAG: hypothetical protein US78_C0006G0026 [Parcubacteria group bacterium GW2011_GWD1_38_1
MRLSLEEMAFELFPDEIFKKDFQESSFLAYNKIVDSIAMLKNPIQRFTSNNGWYAMYRCSLWLKGSGYKLSFVEPVNFLGGTIHIKPFIEDVDEDGNFISMENGIYLPPTFQPSHFKYFERQIVFLDLKNKIGILKNIGCEPRVLSEAVKRFPEKGMIVIENNEIWKRPYIANPSSEQFGKMIKLVDKISAGLKDFGKEVLKEKYSGYTT